jgi:hypothetical protein
MARTSYWCTVCRAERTDTAEYKRLILSRHNRLLGPSSIAAHHLPSQIKKPPVPSQADSSRTSRGGPRDLPQCRALALHDVDRPFCHPSNSARDELRLRMAVSRIRFRLDSAGSGQPVGVSRPFRAAASLRADASPNEESHIQDTQHWSFVNPGRIGFEDILIPP